MPDIEQDEIALISSAIEGDVDAFGHLYTLHIDAIYRYIYFRIGEASEAEDLTEQVFLNAWEALPGYKHMGNPFTSWLYRIAHNAVVDYYRLSKTRANIISKYQQDKEDHSEKNALQQVIDNEEMTNLARAISRLKEDQQQVIILRFMEGYSHKEVAQVLDKKEGACRMIQYRALVNLQQMLEEADRNR